MVCMQLLDLRAHQFKILLAFAFIAVGIKYMLAPHHHGFALYQSLLQLLQACLHKLAVRFSVHRQGLLLLRHGFTDVAVKFVHPHAHHFGRELFELAMQMPTLLVHIEKALG